MIHRPHKNNSKNQGAFLTRHELSERSILVVA